MDINTWNWIYDGVLALGRTWYDTLTAEEKAAVDAYRCANIYQLMDSGPQSDPSMRYCVGNWIMRFLIVWIFQYDRTGARCKARDATVLSDIANEIVAFLLVQIAA
jgi:hypothetical protein